MGDSSISWTDKTWNPVVGCNRVSPGCAHCYAKALHDMRHRAHLAGKQTAPQYALPFETVQLMPNRLDYPLHWRRPARIFVNSVSDLFHEDVPVEFLARVFDVMACATLTCHGHKWEKHTDECWTGTPHTFQVLTKRPERMLKVLTEELPEYVFNCWPGDSALSIAMEVAWPLPNVWLGTSVENQRWADERIPLLLRTPAAVRFLSCEPLLGPVDLLKAMPLDHESDAWDEVNREDDAWDNREPEMEIEESELEADWINYGNDLVPNPEYYEYMREREERARRYMLRDGIQWVIVGGESGPGFRKMDLDWARSLRDQCVAAGVSFFYKQGNALKSEKDKELDGQRWEQMPNRGEVAA